MSKSIEWVAWDHTKKAREVRGPHNLSGKKILHWQFCRRCGLMALKNDESRRLLRKQCVTLEDG